jgi:hypothetical protein
MISCTAALELLHRETLAYIHFNDEVPFQELNRRCKEITHVALAHPNVPGVPGLSADC